MALFLFRAPLKLVSSVVTFVYPLYASYKAITPGARDGAVRRDAQTELLELQTWLMYWSVAGVMHVAEVYVEWIWNWIPFYFEVKLLFVFWLVLPQTRGATLLYVSYIDPFLAEHEETIDAALTEAKVQAKQAGLAYVGKAWDYAKGFILSAAMPQADEQPVGAGHVAPPPSTQNPAQGTTSQLYSLFSTYAPLAVAAGTSALNRARVGAQASPPEHSADAASSSATLKRSSALNAARRAELQRQLTELDDALGSDEGGRSSALQQPIRSTTSRRGAAVNRPSSGESSGNEPDDLSKNTGSNRRAMDASYEMLDHIDDVLEASTGRRTRSAVAPHPDARAAGSSSWFWSASSPPKHKAQ